MPWLRLGRPWVRPVLLPHALRCSVRAINILNWYKKNANTPEQKKLKTELEHGYFLAEHQLSKDPLGKIFPAQVVEDPSLRLPENISAKTLSGRTVDIRNEILTSPIFPALLLVTFRRVNVKPMLAEWKKVFQGNFPQGKERVFEVNLEEDAVYRLFQPLLNWEARASLTKDEQNRSMMLVGSKRYTQRFREGIGIIGWANRLLCYPFLVDSCGQIRWKSVGYPCQEDVEFMKEVTQHIESQKGGHTSS